MIPRFKPDLDIKELKAIFSFKKNAVKKFENFFAQKFEAVDAVAFSYGRSAQWAFLKAIGLEGADIIMPAYTCSVVAHAISLSGNHPKFIDIKLDDYNMNLELLIDAINDKTRAIIATHTFGYPQDINKLEEIVRKAEKKYGHKIWLIQDCCHAFGARWKGKMVGTSGDVAIYALNISKIMTSIFGGMLTFQDKELANKVRKWRDQNFKKPSLLKSLRRTAYLIFTYIAFNPFFYRITWWLQEKTPFLNKLTKSFHLDNKIHFPPDYLDLMINLEAAVGLVQLKKYSSIINTRRKNALKYHKLRHNNKKWIFPPIVNGATYSHYVVRVPNRKVVIKNYAKKGIQLGELIQYSIPHLECYKNIESECPLSELASTSTVNFPVTVK